MKTYNLLAILAALLVLTAGLILLGCKGDTGPQGPAGPPGPPPGDQNTYLGDDQNSCGHCHSDVGGEWQTAAHSHAYTDLVTAGRNLNNYCVQCHTTGFDDVWADSTTRTSQGAGNRGYDDEQRTATQNVQCEACHGPMGPALNHEPILDQALTGEKCGRCHVAYGDYITSAHGTVIARNANGRHGVYIEWGDPSGSCRVCHISEGFLGLPYTEATFHQIACATCHDPHAGGTPSQLRAEKLVTVTLPYAGPSLTGTDTLSVPISDWGKAQICIQCHHSRRGIGGSSGIRTQVTVGVAHPGPHESAQADMLSGNGCYAPATDVAIERNSPHRPSFLADCITCHFTDRAHGDPIHTFEAHLETCQPCHAGVTNFDIDGVQTHVQQLLDSLGMLLPPVGSPQVMDSTNNPDWSARQREAGYAWYFVSSDASRGVHNAPYAISLLQNALRYLQSSEAASDVAVGRN